MHFDKTHSIDTKRNKNYILFHFASTKPTQNEIKSSKWEKKFIISFCVVSTVIKKKKKQGEMVGPGVSSVVENECFKVATPVYDLQ